MSEAVTSNSVFRLLSKVREVEFIEDGVIEVEFQRARNTVVSACFQHALDKQRAYPGFILLFSYNIETQ